MIDELELVKQARPNARPPDADVIVAARLSLERSIAAPARRRRRYPRGLLSAEVIVPALAVLVVIAVAAVFLRAGGRNPVAAPAAGGLRLVFAAQPTAPTHPVGSAEMQRTVRLERDRLASLLPDARVSAAGDELIVRAGRGARAPLDQLLALVQDPGRLLFYDWEANALTPSGRSVAARLGARDPTALEISQGGNSAAPGSPGSGGLSLYAAVRLAARQPRWASGTNSRVGSEYFMFGKAGSAACAAAARHYGVPASSEPCYLAGPEATTSALVDALPPGVDPSGAGIETLTVPQGWTVLKAAPSSFDHPSRWSAPGARYFVLRDDVWLSSGDITNPRGSTDPAGPDVQFGLTSRGRRLFQDVTARVAQRGERVSSVGETFNQHFAVALDTQLITVPSIDFRAYPDGIQASSGADIAGGFTARSAGRLAAELRMGPLPVHLTLVAAQGT